MTSHAITRVYDDLQCATHAFLQQIYMRGCASALMDGASVVLCDMICWFGSLGACPYRPPPDTLRLFRGRWQQEVVPNIGSVWPSVQHFNEVKP